MNRDELLHEEFMYHIKNAMGLALHGKMPGCDKVNLAWQKNVNELQIIIDRNGG